MKVHSATPISSARPSSQASQKEASGGRRVYILGAGITGMVVGWKIAEQGWETTIIEKEEDVGGIAFSRKWRDFQVDFGPHIYHTQNPDLEKLWEEEFGDILVKGDFYCKNVKGENFDQLYDYPLSYESIRRYPPALRDQVLKELAAVDPQARANARNYKEYVRALVGPTLQKMFFEDYPRKIWNLSTEEMTANWAPKRVELREKILPFYTGRWCAVGKDGTHGVLSRIWEKYRKAGGKAVLGNGVAGLKTEGFQIQEILLGDGKKIPVSPRDVVVSTMPIHILARLLQIPCDLSFRGVITVNVAFKKDFILPGGLQFLYYDSPRVYFNRVSEPKRFCDAGFPPDKTFLTCEIAYTPGDERDRKPPEELAREVLDQLVMVGLVRRADYEDSIVFRRPCVYPLQTEDYEHRLRAVQVQLLKYPSLYVVGGPAEFVYSDTHINFLKALDLAKLLVNKYSDFYRVKRKATPVIPNPIVELAGVPVGGGNPPYIIAEAGLNHNGSIAVALRLIEEAQKAGCQSVKFQTYDARQRVSARVKRANYAEEITGLEENILQMFAKFQLSWDDHLRVFEHGRKQGMTVFSSVFDEDSVDLLERLRIPFYKIASSDLVNLPLLRKVARTGKPMILSTGMSTIGEVEEAVEVILEEGNPNIVLLHCVSSYPANLQDLNLNVIRTLKANFNLPVGFSDHCLGLFASQTALAIGADVIERHFTLDRKLEGPDHVFSSEPAEMRELTRYAAQVRTMLGSGTKRIQVSEFEAVNSFKKTLYAKVPIHRGQVIERDMLAVKGPGGGLSPKYMDVVVGRVAQRDIEADFPITWEVV